jgi:hypothetical protein
MSLLDQAFETIENWGAQRSRDRARCVALFKQIVERMNRGMAIWQEFLDKAPQSGDRFTPVLWIGAESAKKLQALYLENKATAVALTQLTGVRFKDSLSLAEDLDVVQPYDQLKSDETGIDRAKAAIGLMTERKRKIDAVIKRLGD